MEAAGGRVLLEVTGVSIHTRLHPAPPRDGLVRGRLLVVQEAEDTVLQWEPLEGPWDPPDDTAPPEEDEEPPDPGYEPDWAVLSPPRPRPPPPGWRGGFRLALGELWGLRRSPPGLCRPFVVLLPRGGPCPPPLHFPRGGPRHLLRLLGPRLRPCPRDPRLLLVTSPEDPGPDPPPAPPSPGLVTRLLQGPYAATVGGLSRLLGGPRGPAPPPEEPEPPFEGLSPEVRLRGWRRLLGLPGEGTDPQERARRDDYFRMKLQWRSLSPGQQRRNRPLRRYRRRLERDLARCHPDVTGPERTVLHDVLMTYCMYHFDLGYVRGMSEVLGPLLAVTPDEVEAFWGFCSIMEMGGNFGPGREGLKRQLGQLGQLLRVLDPNLCDRLEAGGTLGCCSRWLQLRFQPHVGLQGTLRLWEVLWTGLPCPNFLLLLSCALLEGAGDVPPRPGDTRGDTGGDTGGDSSGDTDEDSDRDEGPPGRCRALDAEQLLSRAEGLFLQLAAAPELPPALQELLGLGGPPPRPPPSPPPSPPPPESAGGPPTPSPAGNPPL